MLLPDTTINAVIARSKHSLAIGVAVVVLPRFVQQVHSIGIFTGLTLIALAVFSLVLAAWRTDNGLWMLSGLGLTIYGPVYIYYKLHSCLRIFRNAVPPVANAWQIGEAIDAALALLLFGFLTRFLLTITVRNWTISHQ